MSIILFDKPPVPVQVCSFCKKPKHQVRHMFSNDQDGDAERNICDECVEKSAKLIKEAA